MGLNLTNEESIELVHRFQRYLFEAYNIEIGQIASQEILTYINNELNQINSSEIKNIVMKLESLIE
ncbi:DUF2164 family protein [Bacillus sp. SM2101]|uniref:DUF2164 family protein n=1 Tax=Bacillus sp. SM2101 TaxID=2805366 RepID=UPI001BDEF759|nr:DUF2164 family protein [Bacillus sp. SM2101]